MKLNRFSRRHHAASSNKRATKALIKSAAASRPSVETLEDRQMLSLTVDYRVFDSSTPKAASVTSVGQVVYLQEWVTITGSTAGSNDGLFEVTGSAISTKTSSTESVNGNMTDQLTPTFSSSGSEQGTPTDLNGDGNLDVGSNNNSDDAGFIDARAGGLEQNGTVSGDSMSFVVATLVYTVTSLSYGQATDVNFKYRDGVPSGAFDAVWWQDGAGQNDQNDTIAIGAPVVISDTNLSPPVTGSIAGTVYKTVSGTTSAFAGQTVYLDLGDTGSYVSGDPEATTSSTGTYSFTGIAAGTYYVREIVPSGYTQTSPGSSPTTITIKTGATSFTGENFTDTAASVVAPTGSISGTVSKVVSGATSVFSGVTVYLDANDNGSLDSGETSTTTSSAGTYSFTGLAAGTYYIREVVPSGYSQTSPASSPTTVALSTSSSTASSENFTDTAATVTTTGSLLKGTVIGTAGSWDNDGLTIANAFDSNLSTYFVGPTANGDWAGLNLGAEYKITSIKYAPQPSWASRMVGGTFQGSSNATFTSGDVTLATITSAPTAGVYTTASSISSTASFEYVRYVGPNGSYGDVAEIQFYGISTGSAPAGPIKLTGTVIGTSGSWDNSGNTISKAFDGSLTTYFDGPVANGDWAGLDLGSAQTIGQISYAPRSGWASRMVGGTFQASNSSTFASGVVNLFTISATPATGSLTTVSVSVSGTYRYVRYIGPAGSYGDVAEVDFYS